MNQDPPGAPAHTATTTTETWTEATEADLTAERIMDERGRGKRRRVDASRPGVGRVCGKGGIAEARKGGDAEGVGTRRDGSGELNRRGGGGRRGGAGNAGIESVHGAEAWRRWGAAIG